MLGIWGCYLTKPEMNTKNLNIFVESTLQST